MNKTYGTYQARNAVKAAQVTNHIKAQKKIGVPHEEAKAEEQKKSEAQDENEQSTRDEKKEALAQWLRRVPDDPGGLIRRKFQHETKQRLRRGEYENRQGDKVW